MPQSIKASEFMKHDKGMNQGRGLCKSDMWTETEMEWGKAKQITEEKVRQEKEKGLHTWCGTFEED